MTIDYDPFCPVCGGPFSHVDPFSFSGLDEDEQYLKEITYNMDILPDDQFMVSRRCFWSLLGAGINTGSWMLRMNLTFRSSRGLPRLGVLTWQTHLTSLHAYET